jgi:hypothetical protein
MKLGLCSNYQLSPIPMNFKTVIHQLSVLSLHVVRRAKVKTGLLWVTQVSFWQNKLDSSLGNSIHGSCRKLQSKQMRYEYVGHLARTLDINRTSTSKSPGYQVDAKHINRPK